MNKLSNEVQERIKADAKHYADVHWGDPAKFTTATESIHHSNCEEDYIAAATAMAERTEQAIENALHAERNAIQAKIIGMEVGYMKQIKGLVDAMELAKSKLNWIENADAIDIIREALQQWKEGKEVDNG